MGCDWVQLDWREIGKVSVITANVESHVAALQEQYQEVFSESLGTITPFQSQIFLENCKSLDDSRIPVIKDECGVTTTDDSTKASILNGFFSKCFNRSVPPLIASEQPTFLNASSDDCPPNLLCSEEEVLGLLLSLDTTKANGPLSHHVESYCHFYC